MSSVQVVPKESAIYIVNLSMVWLPSEGAIQAILTPPVAASIDVVTAAI